MRLPTGKNNQWLVSLSPLALAVVSQLGVAKGLDVTASVEGSTLLQNRHSEVIDEELLTYSITPEVVALLNTRTFTGRVTANVTHLDRDAEDASRKDTFAEYNYDLSWQAIDNLLRFQTQGTQRYIDSSGSDFLVSDYFLNADSLAKVQTQSYSSFLTLPQGDLVAGNASLTYSKTEGSENEFRSTDAINNDSLTGNLLFTSGDDANAYFWMIQGTYQDLERDESSSTGDYTSKYANGYIDTVLYRPWAVRVTATYDANELADSTDEFSNDRNFKSYGIGLTYRLAADRYIAVTANKIDSDVEDDDGDTFVGLDAQWAITPRTSLQASYGRRFYGKSASASINYNSRKVRGLVSYTEQVTSYSALAASPQTLGVFVCPAGDFSADACFQPSSLDYTPADDEQLIQIITTGLELSNAIILRKSAVAQLGLQGRHTTLIFNVQYSDDDYLELDRQRETYAASLSASYELSRYSSLLSSVKYGYIEQAGTSTSEGDNEQWAGTIGYKRDFGQYLSGNVELGYIRRSGTLNTTVYGTEYDERRITFSLKYDFK
ncbi:TIGR03016 family PEP-CTERM system-associated outer membrane protein [Alteromonas sp. C1M14]|uniref:TIGR03016 family PEP-CTERM system-associated outer membrane protein n=1 Tax=Alteromonas sp. C1M14 TaxID=2841567 RepID=UPI001C0A1F54|nr:TIGR03016 family PEP-CTERM system-associated outer membrane protein [Alteromonas sp. C1M14]MBU2979221.1 TIGR03016 family PEP-CTERM system-associated outer membrane protein [Alteromonas sp. C1M14]